MDINQQKLIDSLKSSHLSNFNAIEVLDGWIEVTTPLYDAHGDGISVCIKQIEGTDNVLVSDDGITLSWFPNDRQLSKARQKYIDSILSANCMQENNREYTMQTSVSCLYSSIIMFASAIIAISHIEYIDT